MARKARIADVHRIAAGMPHVTMVDGTKGRPVYQVGQKSFVFFRNARADAFDPGTGEIDVDELTEMIQDAWLAQASRRRGEAWLGGQ